MCLARRRKCCLSLLGVGVLISKKLQEMSNIVEESLYSISGLYVDYFLTINSVLGVIKQWDRYVMPNFTKYVEPQKKNSDVLIPRGIENTIAISTVPPNSLIHMSPH